MNNLLNKSRIFLSRNAPTILTCVGAVGVAATSVMAVKATPKALSLLEEAKKEKGEELTKVEVVKVAGPSYIPAIMVGVSTVACIFSANVLNRRSQAAIMSAYALIDNSYKEYRAKVKELYGEEADKNVKTEIAKDEYAETDIVVEADKTLFYDYFSDRYFQSTLDKVIEAEYQLNKKLITREYAYLNDFYDYLEIEPIQSGHEYGWTRDYCYTRSWETWIEFTHEKVVMEDGMECYIISMVTEPVLDFEEFC